jgi:hypothetical protein
MEVRNKARFEQVRDETRQDRNKGVGYSEKLEKRDCRNKIKNTREGTTVNTPAGSGKTESGRAARTRIPVSRYGTHNMGLYTHIYIYTYTGFWILGWLVGFGIAREKPGYRHGIDIGPLIPLYSFVM